MEDLTTYNIRCSCGSVLSKYKNRYLHYLSEGYSRQDALDLANCMRSCCRLEMITKPCYALGLHYHAVTESNAHEFEQLVPKFLKDDETKNNQPNKVFIRKILAR
jgi:DNA-directed RNA polymerase subunit N (RpoN/RPB10)